MNQLFLLHHFYLHHFYILKIVQKNTVRYFPPTIIVQSSILKMFKALDRLVELLCCSYIAFCRNMQFAYTIFVLIFSVSWLWVSWFTDILFMNWWWSYFFFRTSKIVVGVGRRRNVVIGLLIASWVWVSCCSLRFWSW